MRRRYIQDPDTHELVPADEYRGKRAASRGPMIAPDIQPFEVPGEPGNVIGGRRQKREFMRARGLVEVGNDAPAWMREREYEARHGRK